MKQLIFLIGYLLAYQISNAQGLPGRLNRGMNTTPQIQGARKDTIGFEHRNDAKDSINISYRFFDSTNRNRLDSGINDFDKYYSVPSTYQYLGNNGAAAVSLIFNPMLQPGWDAGFHAYDVYRLLPEATRLYKTTRPFSMLSYQLATGKEQMIKALHTQNPKPNLNVGFDYRLISAPGLFLAQNTNHNNVRFFGSYNGKRKRYNAAFTLVSNNIRASENGGIKNDSSLLDPNKKARYSIDVNFGNASTYNSNPFATTIRTGNTYKDFTFLYRHSYDIGRNDSLEINDSTTEYLFYPKLRVQHTFTYSSYQYNFRDVAGDSVLYRNWYNITFPGKADTFAVGETWKILSNDFSLVQFPDIKNSSQFFLAGATLQTLQATFTEGSGNFYNVKLHGEYRNRTRNKLWDVLLKGEFYLNGLNSGDYSAYGTIGRYLNKRFGNINLFFNNVNRTPSFIFDNRSSFHLGNDHNFKKENITAFGARAVNPYVQLAFTNYLVSNYTYFTNYYQADQYNKLINLVQASASKTIRLTKHINWYTDIILQQVDKAVPIKVPLVYTRNRFAFEGNFFKNLKLSTGVEIRYYSAYNAPNYSPVIGQFIPQDTFKIKNKPDVSAFLHFRIKGFAGYVRAENLNTVNFQNGFGFVDNNFAAPHYPTPGLMIRFGIQWWFVN